MKKLQLVCAIFWVLTAQFITAQTAISNTHALFAKPGLSIGSYHYNFYDGTWNTSLRYLKDTVLCNRTLLCYDYIGQSGMQNIAYFWIDGGKVSRFLPNSCYAYTPSFDFDLVEGDSFNLTYVGWLKLTQVDSFELENGEKRKRLTLKTNSINPSTFEWIEGIGDRRYGLQYAFYDFEGYEQMVCVRDNGVQLYHNTPQLASINCDSILCPVPLPSFSYETADKTAVFFNQSEDATSIEWDFGDGTTSTEPNPTHVYTEKGCYFVTLKVKTQCLQRVFEQQKTVPICIDPKWVSLGLPSSLAGIPGLEFVSTQIGWAFSGNNLFKTVDSGASWNQQSIPLPAAPVTRRITGLSMRDSLNGIITCGHYNSSTGDLKAILITHDGGETWAEQVDGSYWQHDPLATADGKVFSKGSYGNVNFSSDGGDTWTTYELPLGYDIGDWQYLDNDSLIAHCWYGLQPNVDYLMGVSADNGATWTFYPTAPDDTFVQGFYFLDGQKGWLSSYASSKFWRTLDGGQTWTEVTDNNGERVIDIDFADALNGWAVGNNGLVLHTTDGGDTWQRENCGAVANLGSIQAPDAEHAFLTGASAHAQQYRPDPSLDCDASNSAEIAPKASAFLKITPNPAFETAQITIPSSAATRLMLLDAFGKVVLETAVSSEWHTLNTVGLRPGIYWVRLDSGEVGKLVVGK